MIVGGIHEGGIEDSKMTEVVELVQTSNSTPSFGQLPSARFGAVGAMLGSTPILCGGTTIGDVNPYYDDCVMFQNSQWDQSHIMNEMRAYAAGVQINSTTLWILGGLYSSGDGSSHYLDSTEFISQGGHLNGVPGSKLPYAMGMMCSVKLSEEEIFVIGGHDGDLNWRNEVWIYNPQKEFARNQGPSLNSKRGYHSCSTMRDGEKTLIIVAGGYNGVDSLSTVEIYNPTDKKWHLGETK